MVRNKFKGAEELSSVSILNEGEEFVRYVLTPLRIALTDTPGGEQLRHAWSTITWKDFAPKALQLHKDSSNRANPTGTDAQVSKIKGIISENPGIRTSEIQQKLKELGLPYKSSTYLKQVFESGGLRKVEEGKSVRWYPAEETAQDESI